MKQKELELWKLYGEDKYLVVNPDELIQRVSFYETEAYMFSPDTDMDLIRKVLAEYRNRKEEDETLRFYEILDEYGIAYEGTDEAEDYNPDVVLCFPNDDDLKWAVCRMSDLILGVSDVFHYWDGSNWQEIWAENDVQHRLSVVIDEETKENLDEWDGSNWCYLQPFNHGRLYKILTVDSKPVENKWLLWESADWQGSLDWGTIVEEKDLDRVRNWDADTGEEGEEL